MKNSSLRKEQGYVQVESAGGGYQTMSTQELLSPDESSIRLAFYHEESERAGTWGLIDKNGREVIVPQYLFSLYFDENGYSVAVKGKWEYRDNWRLKDEYYPGYWTDKELWGVIDIHNKEVIPFKYDEIRTILSDDGKSTLGYAVWRKHWQEMALFDHKGKQLTDFIYLDCDFGAFDDFLIISVDKPLYETGTRCGLYDFRTHKLIIEPKYGSIEVVDRESDLLYVSNDPINSYNGYLINAKEERVGSQIWRDEPSTLGLDMEKLPKNTYRSTLPDGQKCYFNVDGKKINITKYFTTIFIERWQIECCGDDQPFSVGDDIKWYGVAEDDRSLQHDKHVDYLYESHGAPEICDPQKLHKISGKIFKIYNCYNLVENPTREYQPGEIISGHNEISVRKAKRWNNDHNGLPFIGWLVILENADIKKYYTDEEIEQILAKRRETARQADRPQLKNRFRKLFLG